MILIVDDDMAMRLSVGLLARSCGLEPLEASNEDDALRLIRDERVRIVLLDMNLTLSSTGRQGIELLRKFKILRPEVPVILITGWGTIPLAVEGMKFGASDFMTKPWSNDDLRGKIRRLLSDAERIKNESSHVESLDSVEREAVIHAISIADGNLSLAARHLGITRQALYRRIKKFDL